jgi:predicted RNA binding protein YcfA (HicA-like mRNA interferase family)
VTGVQGKAKWSLYEPGLGALTNSSVVFPRLIQPLKARALIGFQTTRQHGSHLVMKHPDGRITVVPIHKGEELGRGILRKIAKDVQISKEELMQLLDDI